MVFCDQGDIFLPVKVTIALEVLIEVVGKRPATYCASAEIVNESLNHTSQGYYKLLK